MRIGIAVHELNIRGGTHKQVQRLAEHLREAGESVRVYTKYYDPERCYPGIEALAVRAASARRQQPTRGLAKRLVALATSLRMAAALARECDVVNVHDGGLTLVWLVARLLNPRLRFVWQVNDLPGGFGVGKSTHGKRHGLRRRWNRLLERVTTRFMARRVELVTVNVSKNAERVRDCLGVAAKVIHCGVDLRNDRMPERRAGARAGDRLRIVSTGVFFPYRNYEAILRAQERLRERFGVESSLAILGSTSLSPGYADSVRAIAAELGVECEILGEVDEATLASRYRSADVFAFVNVDQSWGLAVFEAMDFGLPVVVSRSVGAIEILEPGVDSEVVDPQDPDAIAEALHRLHADPALHQARSAAAFAATRRMTWPDMYCEPMRRELWRVVRGEEPAEQLDADQADAGMAT